MRIDFHSHILPDMDDGSKDADESLELLRMLCLSNVECVALTSHFYCKDEDIASFVKRREKALEALKARLVKAADFNVPNLVVGAEVYFYPSLADDPDIDKLCIENTDYLLLELPFESFRDNFYRSFANFSNRCSKKIILAHLERYLKFGKTPDDLKRLFEYGDFVIQLNCTSLARARFKEKRIYSEMLSSPAIIGTDTHNTVTRPPMYDKAEKFIVKKCGEDVFERICKNGELILRNKDIR